VSGSFENLLETFHHRFDGIRLVQKILYAGFQQFGFEFGIYIPAGDDDADGGTRAFHPLNDIPAVQFWQADVEEKRIDAVFVRLEQA
jgi:hypothetical protein